MAKHLAYKRRTPLGQVEFNMTGMIDCTFQLIIFFFLAGQMASESLTDLVLPHPERSQAIPSEQIENPSKAIVNVVSAVGEGDDVNPALLGKAERYQIGGIKLHVGERELLCDVLKRLKRASNSEEFTLEIRADHRVDYSEVQPVMQAAVSAGIAKMNITAITDSEL